MEGLTNKGIQGLKSTVNDMFKLFDAKPQGMDGLDKAEEAFNLDKLKDSSPINEDMDLDFPDIDLEGLMKGMDSFLPSGNWFDSLFGSDETKIQ